MKGKEASELPKQKPIMHPSVYRNKERKRTQVFFQELTQAQKLLTSISARIMQISNRKANVAMGAATNALVGSGFASGMMALIASFGTASTGTALAGLSGAAKTTATLYWIGGAIGGGVAAGTLVVGAGAVGAGIYGSLKVRRALIGHSRRADDLSEHERLILQATHSLVSAITATLNSNAEVTKKEVAIFSRVGITPLVNEINLALKNRCFDDLNHYNRALLRGDLHNMKSLQDKLENE